MRIAIYSPTSTLLDMGSIEKGLQSLGGADSTLIRMIDFLSEEHEVIAYLPVKEVMYMKKDKGSVIYFPFMMAHEADFKCDILINYRKVHALPRNIQYKKLIFYSQDTIDTPAFSQFDSSIVEYMKMFDKIIVLSEFHKNNLNGVLNLPDFIYSIVGNATEEQDISNEEKLSNFENNDFIYASTPFRGLVVLMKMWPIIKQRIPNAKLHVYSSMKIYGSETHDLMFENMYKSLSKMDGVIYYGSRPQKEIFSMMKKCKLMLYPNVYPETYCNVVMESRACKTPIITSAYGNLKNVVGTAGFCIEGNPYFPGYQNNFIDNVEAICKDKDLYKLAVENCYPVRTWNNYYSDLKEVLEL